MPEYGGKTYIVAVTSYQAFNTASFNLANASSLWSKGNILISGFEEDPTGGWDALFEPDPPAFQRPLVEDSMEKKAFGARCILLNVVSWDLVATWMGYCQQNHGLRCRPNMSSQFPGYGC